MSDCESQPASAKACCGVHLMGKCDAVFTCCDRCPTFFRGPTPASPRQQDAPLVVREAGSVSVPPTWCVTVCEQGCWESWAVDVADFEPRLTASDVERLLTPLLIAHEVEHGRW